MCKGPTLYARLKAAGCKIANHETDLYVHDTPAARAVIAEYSRENTAPWFERFINPHDGTIWLDIPFFFEPAWPKRGETWR